MFLHKAFGILGAAALLAASITAASSQAYSTTGGYGSATITNISPAGGAAITAQHPLGYGTLGSYSKTLVSGVIGAGASANSPVYSFRYGGTNLALIRSVQVSVVNAGTAFTAGTVNLSMYPARAFTASDSGGTAGTLTGNNGKLRTSMGTTAVSDIRVSSTAALTPGTRTLDTDPVGALLARVPITTTDYSILARTNIFSAEAALNPLVLATNEGFVIQATVPATGTWTVSVQVYWDELPSSGF